jgi:signal transduction histidine kinase
LARVEQARRDMIGDVAHELRTPLTNIRCQLEAVQDGLAAANAQTVASLHDEVMLLGRLVDDLRDLALADAGQLAMTREIVSMEEVIRGAASSIAARARSANVSVHISIAEKLPPISGDAARLVQVLRNLLENALAHSPRDGTIVLEASATERELLVSVRDSGPGIPAEHLPHIFERFYRTDPSRSRESGGAGLGLAIVRQIVNAHGGRVWAENASTGGAIFFVSLPITFSESERNRQR